MPLSLYEKKSNYGSHEKTSSQKIGSEKSTGSRKENGQKDRGQTGSEKSGKIGGSHDEENRFRTRIFRWDGHNRRNKSRGTDDSPWCL